MSKRLKILLVTNSIPLPETDFLKYKLFGLSKLFDVHLICWDSKENRQKFYDKYGNEYKIHLFHDKWSIKTMLDIFLKNKLRILSSPIKSSALLRQLSQTYLPDKKKVAFKFNNYFPIQELNPDIIHFEYGTLAHSFSDIKKFVDAKTIVSFRGYDLNYVGLEHSNFYEEVWRSFDGFHFLGNDLKNRSLKRGYKEDKKEVLIPPGVDTNVFKPSDNRKQNELFRIVSVGRLAWKKGYEYGLQAVALLKKKNIPFEYRIIAEGNYIQPIQFAIQELGLENEVLILRNKTSEDVIAELQQADVFLHPAISEGFSNAVLEAQATGVPVIATNADGLAENIADSITGYIVPIYDAEAMADKLEWVYNNSAEAKQMGMNGIDRVKANFTIEEQIKKFEIFYKQVAEVE